MVKGAAYNTGHGSEYIFDLLGPVYTNAFSFETYLLISILFGLATQ